MAAISSRRKAVTEAIAEKLKEINGVKGYKTDLNRNVYPQLRFMDEVEEFPEVHVFAGQETREYLPSQFKWRYLTITIRVYVNNEDDPQEELSLALEDLETCIDTSSIDYVGSDGTIEQITEITIINISTDEGVLIPLGVGEMVIEVRY